MANNFPLILNTTSSTIQELPSGDNLDLSGSDISNVNNINSVGSLTTGAVTYVNTMVLVVKFYQHMVMV